MLESIGMSGGLKNNQPTIERKDDFVNHILNELDSFELSEQNYILKMLYDATKERRLVQLNELKSRTEILSKIISDLG